MTDVTRQDEIQTQKARLATVWLDGCSGCHMSLLDMDETLLAIAPRVALVFSPLVDTHEFPSDVDITLVEGAVSNEADLAMAKQLRTASRLVVALGDCAVTANVPGMRNTVSVSALLARVYASGSDPSKAPAERVPPLLPRALPLHEVIQVDLHIPGCPPRPATLVHVLTELLAGRQPSLAGRVKFG